MQNVSLVIVICVPSRTQVKPLLCQLHWLPVCSQVKFKVLFLTFKDLHSMELAIWGIASPWLHLFICPDPTQRACYESHWLGSDICQTLGNRTSLLWLLPYGILFSPKWDWFYYFWLSEDPLKPGCLQAWRPPGDWWLSKVATLLLSYFLFSFYSCFK